MRKFKFFEGLDEYTFVLNVDGRLRALWEPEERLEIDVVDEVTNVPEPLQDGHFPPSVKWPLIHPSAGHGCSY